MTCMRDMWTFLMLFALAAVPTSVLTLCPANCNCRGDNNNIVICTGLAELPVLEGEITDISITDGTISNIPDGYFNISSLGRVDLSNNQLVGLRMESFVYTPSIETITLTGNDIVCDENIDWLAMWTATYLLNTVVGTCTRTGATIEDYLSGKPSKLFDTSLGTSDNLRFGGACEELSINLHVDALATEPLMYMVTFTPEDESTADHLQLVDSEVTIPTGTTSTVIQFRVVDQGSGQDRVYSLTVIPKYFTAQFIVTKMLLVDGNVPCTSGELAPSVTPSESPSFITDPPLVITGPPPIITDPPSDIADPPPVITDPPAVITSPPPVITDPPPVITDPPSFITDPPENTTMPEDMEVIIITTKGGGVRRCTGGRLLAPVIAGICLVLALWI